jgi:hypothetical protein
VLQATSLKLRTATRATTFFHAALLLFGARAAKDKLLPSAQARDARQLATVEEAQTLKARLEEGSVKLSVKAALAAGYLALSRPATSPRQLPMQASDQSISARLKFQTQFAQLANT